MIHIFKWIQHESEGRHRHMPLDLDGYPHLLPNLVPGACRSQAFCDFFSMWPQGRPEGVGLCQLPASKWVHPWNTRSISHDHLACATGLDIGARVLAYYEVTYSASAVHAGRQAGRPGSMFAPSMLVSKLCI